MGEPSALSEGAAALRLAEGDVCGAQFLGDGLTQSRTTYTAPPGDIAQVAVAPSAAGPFTALSGAVPIGLCGGTRGVDDYTLSFSFSPTVVGAVRVQVSNFNTGVDAVGIR